VIVIHFDFSNYLRQTYLYSDCTIEQALKSFKSNAFNCLPVVNSSQQYLGIVRLRDLIFEIRPDISFEINDLLVACPTCFINATLHKVEWSHDVDVLPFIDDNGYYKGFITKTDYIHLTHTYTSMSDMIINYTHNGIISVNKHGNIITFNPTAEKMIGMTRQNVLNKPMASLNEFLDLSKVLETGRSSLGHKIEYNGYIILCNKTVILNDQDDVIGALCVLVDVTDFETTNSHLISNQILMKELNTIIESSFDGLMVVDKQGTLVRVNSSWERICGFKREEVIGKKIDEFVTKGYWDNSCALLTLEREETTSIMIEITSGPKKSQKIIATGTPVWDDHGDICSSVMNIRDYTALETLKRQLNEAQALNKRYAYELNEIRYQHLTLQDIVAKSAAMKDVIDLTVRVAQVNSTVVITGESGVGKEVIAKTIHRLSNRRDQSMIKINCGAIPDALLESELFGYDGGAFTGSKKEGKPGMFELASNGTLFLDELGELPLHLQVKLLRVLQEQELVRVGGIKPIKINTRIITATNKDLEQMVQEGSFRKDLFYRLNVINIHIPPLRNRREDIPPLINIILSQLNKKHQFQKSLSPQVIEQLCLYEWPGNTRELENILERIVVLNIDNTITVKHLPAFIRQNYISAPITVNQLVTLKEAVHETEMQLIQKALDKHPSTRKAAKVLGVNQSTITRKMQQYSLRHRKKNLS